MENTDKLEQYYAELSEKYREFPPFSELGIPPFSELSEAKKIYARLYWLCDLED